MMLHHRNGLTRSAGVLGLLLTLLLVVGTFYQPVGAQLAASNAPADKTVATTGSSGGTVSVASKLDPKRVVTSAVKGEQQTPQGKMQPELVTSGTYAFTSATGVALQDMSSGTTQLVGAGLDDTVSALTNIGFTFRFDGVNFTQFTATANGFIRLGAAAGTSDFNNATIFASTTDSPKIAPYFDDLCTGTNGKVHYKVIGSAPNRTLVVEWQNMQVSRSAGCGLAGNGTFQALLAETTGVITFGYAAIQAPDVSSDGGYSVGIQSGAATNFASITTAGPTVSYVTAANAQANVIAAGTKYTLTPNVPAAPTGLNFTAVGASSMTLNWTDNATNESGYLINRSTDNVNFIPVTTTAANATSFVATGLTANTTYFWQVIAVSEGAFSSTLTGSQLTPAAGSISSTGAGGLWSSTGTWVGGVVPTANDGATIVNGATVTIDTAAVAYSVTVNSGGSLLWDATVARTLVVGAAVTIASGGSFQSAATGTVTTHALTVGADLTNNGTLDFSTNANTAAASITFTGVGNNTFGGTGATTDIRSITVNKGTSSANVLELNSTNFTVQGVTTDVAGFLTVTNGTFKISGTFSMTNRVFTAAAYTIPATGGFWLNNANFTVAGQNGSPTDNGLLQISTGAFIVGTATGNSMGFGNGSFVTVEGGTVTATGRWGVAAAANIVTYNQSGGTVTVNTIGNASTTLASFDLGSSSGSVFNMSSGSIIIVQAGTGTGTAPRDYRAFATPTFSGGTLQIGTAATATNFLFRIQGFFPNLVLNNTTNNKSAQLQTNTSEALGNVTINTGTTLNLNGLTLFVDGNTFTNNGTLTGTTAGSTLYFSGSAAQSYTGTGVITAGLATISVDNPDGVTIDPASANFTVLRVNLFQGALANFSKLTIGTGAVSTGSVIQFGATGITNINGNIDGAPTYNPGSSGIILIYAPEGSSRTTGLEIPVSRSITNLLIITDPNSLILAGGDLTVTGVLTLTSGNVTTGANTLILGSAGTVTRTLGQINGNYTKVYSAVASKVFEVGTANGYSPVTVNITAGTFPASFTVKAVQAALPTLSDPTKALQRYWTLTGSGVTATLTFNYLDPTDIPGTATEANFVIVKDDGAITFPGGTVNTTANTATITGVTAFSNWTLAEPAAVATNTPTLTPLLTSTSTNTPLPTNTPTATATATVCPPLLRVVGPTKSNGPAALRQAPKSSKRVSAAGLSGSHPMTAKSPRSPISFIVDDGSIEDSIGFGSSEDDTEAAAIWLNQFSPAPSDYPITLQHISIGWLGAGNAGMESQTLRLLVYFDADADSDPFNATLVSSSMVTVGALDTIASYPVNISLPGPSGDIYIGFEDAWAESGSFSPRFFPAAIDEDESQESSWLIAMGDGSAPDFTVLDNNDLGGLVDDFGLPGNWVIRADGNSGPLGCPSTYTPTAVPSDTATITATPSNTPTSTASPSNTPVNTATNTPVDTATNTATNTPVNTATNTPVNTATNTPVDTATNTATNTPVNTATNTPVNTATNTPVDTATNTATNTPVNTATNTPAVTDTPSNTATRTNTPGATSTATRTSTATNTPLPAQPVGWIDLVGAIASGNTITKTAASGLWDAGGASNMQILSGDGYAQATVNDTTRYVIFGLTHSHTTVAFSEVNYAIYTYANTGDLAIYENGAYKAGFPGYVAGDVIKVSLESGVIKYYKNSTLLYTSTQTPVLPLLAVADLNTQGGQLNNAIIAGNLGPVTPWTPTATATSTSTPLSLTATPVTWIDQVNVNASGNSFTKIGPASAWDAGAASSKQILSGDGYAQMTINDTTRYLMFGLAHNHTGTAFAEIDYAVYTYANTGDLAIYENGAYKAGFNGYSAGDAIKVAIQGGVVKYYKNSTLLYTSAVLPTYPLLAVGDIFTSGGVVSNGLIAGTLGNVTPWTPTPGPTATNTPASLTCNNVTFANLVNSSASGNTLTKTSGVNAWNAGATSSQSIASGNGNVSETINDVVSYTMFGLGTGNNNGNYTGINYAIYTYASTGQLAIYESGVYRGNFGSYTIGDVIKVAVEGSVVNYYKNASLLYTSSVVPSYPLLLNAAINTPGGKINLAQICGSNLTPVAGARPDPNNGNANGVTAPKLPSKPGPAPAAPVVPASRGEIVPAAPVVPHSGIPVPAQPVVPAIHSSFVDVPANFWAAQYIDWAVAHIGLSGYDGANGREFRPNATANRGQVVKLLVAASGWALVSGEQHFSDVPANSAFYKWIETAAAHNVVSGYADGTFRPNATLTRAQMVKIVVLAAGWQLATPNGQFSDVPNSNWAAAYVATAAGRNVVSGYADGTFHPEASLTRAQMVKLLYNGFAQ